MLISQIRLPARPIWEMNWLTLVWVLECNPLLRYASYREFPSLKSGNWCGCLPHHYYSFKSIDEWNFNIGKFAMEQDFLSILVGNGLHHLYLASLRAAAAHSSLPPAPWPISARCQSINLLNCHEIGYDLLRYRNYLYLHRI